MNKSVKMTVREFHDSLKARLNEVEKKASALKATDPSLKGGVEIPSFNTEKNRSNINLPSNPTNLDGAQDMDGTQGLCSVTNPTGVGQGEYPKMVNGNAKDEAYTTPATPISKIAGDLVNSTLDSFEMPNNIKNDIPLMQKLAAVGGHVLATKKGRKLVSDIMTKSAGRAEAQAILQDVYNDLQKEASANQYAAQVQAMENQHRVNLNAFQYDFEKRAYMQGAVDGDQMAQAAEIAAADPAAMDPAMAAEMAAADPAMGGIPEAPIAADQAPITDEEAIAAIQALIESGEVSPEEVNAFLTAIQQDQAPQYTAQEIAAMLVEDVQSGQITPEIADAIAAEVLQGVEAGQIPVA